MTLKPLKIIALNIDALENINTLCALYPHLGWSSLKLKESLEQTYALALGLLIDDTLVSFALCNIIADEAELLLIITHSEYLGCGYARALLQHLLRALYAKQVNKVFLEVRASNHAAISLYQNLGFKSIHVRKNYYPRMDNAGPEDALIMKLSLPHD